MEERMNYHWLLGRSKCKKMVKVLAHIRLCHFGQLILVSLTENLGAMFLSQL